MLPARTYIEETLKLKHNIETAFLALGERLYRIQEGCLWRGAYNSYEEFLVDLDISPSQASRLKSIYEVLILQHSFKPSKIAHIGQRRLYAVLPMCTSKSSSAAILEATEGLTSKDVELMVRSEKVGKHQHEWITYTMCAVCRETRRVHSQ
jgi:hypothetical protein